MACIEKGLLGINIRTQNIAIAIIQMVIQWLSCAALILIQSIYYNEDYQQIDNDTSYDNLIHR